MKRLLFCVGTRPQFIKAAAILPELRKRVETTLIHTGQHYDTALSDVFFRDMDIPKPALNLGVGSGLHSDQISAMLKGMDPVLRDGCEGVLVVGDSNTTLACALAAANHDIPVAHYEAGLRGDFAKHEQKVQRLVDSVADLHLPTTTHDAENLRRGGLCDSIHMVGNVLVDLQQRYRAAAEKLGVWSNFGLERGSYALVTMHKDVNVAMPIHDYDRQSGTVIDTRIVQVSLALRELSDHMPVVLPAHPKAKEKIRQSMMVGRSALEELPDSLTVLEPQSYLRMLSLLLGARVVVTDSGGLQEEAAAAGVPCVTVWRQTERMATVEAGWNRCAEPEDIPTAVQAAIAEAPDSAMRLEGWDGKAAERVAAAVEEWLC